MDEEHVKCHVSKLFNKLIDQTAAGNVERFYPLLSDLQANKIVVSNPKVIENFVELKAILDKAAIADSNSNSNVNEERTRKRFLLNEMIRVFYSWTTRLTENTNHTDGDDKLLAEYKTAADRFQVNVKTFTDRSLRAVEMYLNTLSTAEQQEKEHLRDSLTAVQNEPVPIKQAELLNKVFIFDDDTE